MIVSTDTCSFLSVSIAQVKAGSQEARSEQVIEVPAKLDGLKMTNHVKDLFQDVTKREMVMNSVVTIAGDAVVWKLRHHFEVCQFLFTSFSVISIWILALILSVLLPVNDAAGNDGEKSGNSHMITFFWFVPQIFFTMMA